MINLSSHADIQKRETDDNENILYSLHHIHHYRDVNDLHEVHHCFLYELPEMSGKIFEIDHVIAGSDVHHYVKGECGHTKLYDHNGNTYRLNKKEINNTTYLII